MDCVFTESIDYFGDRFLCLNLPQLWNILKKCMDNILPYNQFLSMKPIRVFLMNKRVRKMYDIYFKPCMELYEKLFLSTRDMKI